MCHFLVPQGQTLCQEEEPEFNPICPYDNAQSFDCFSEWYSKNYNGTKNHGMVDEINAICGISKNNYRNGNNSVPKIRNNVRPFYSNSNTENDQRDPFKHTRCRYDLSEALRKLTGQSFRQFNPNNEQQPYPFENSLLGKIVYTPNDARANRIMESVVEQNFRSFIRAGEQLNGGEKEKKFRDMMSYFIDCITDRFIAVQNEAALLEKADLFDSKGKLLAAVVFHFDEDSVDLPSYLNYTVRIRAKEKTWGPSRRPPPTGYRPRQPDRENKDFLLLVIQDMIDNAFMKLSSHSEAARTNFAVTLKQMSQNCLIREEVPGYAYIVAIILPFFLALAFLIPFGLLVSSIVQEKEDGMKHFMLVMSMKQHHYWAAWYICSMLWWVVLSLPMHIILTFVLSGYADISLIFFLTVCYIVACIPQAFLLSCFFNSVTSAITASSLLYLLLIYFSANFVLNDYLVTSDIMVLLSLIPQLGIIVGSHFFIMDMGPDNFATWTSLTFDTQGGQYICITILILLLDAVLYFLLTLYFDSIFSASHSRYTDWCFCFKTLATLCKRNIGPLKRKKTSTDNGSEIINGSDTNTSDTEATSQQLRSQNARGLNAMIKKTDFQAILEERTGVEIISVTKMFHSQVEEITAVNNVTLKFSPNEISVLLGQNGAGKTTLFSLIVGTHAATSGDIYIEGINILEDLERARETIGFCPQSNTLFPDLNVMEHIWFFDTIKTGQYPAQSEINQMLIKAKLQEFKYVAAKELSGGTKRKLSVCLAFCGNTKVVLLDEPTSGIDPSSRRSIWSLLNEFKVGRTIIMSTHFMEEADEIGDKVAIIDLGNLKAFDTTMALKQRYAQFYKLVVFSTGDQAISMVDQLVANFFDMNKYEGLEEIEYTIPNRDKSDVEKLQQILAKLEKQSGLDFGVKSSGMEDVFMASIGNVNKYDKTEQAKQIFRPQVSKSKAAVWLQHAYALLVKRFCHLKRDTWSLFIQYVFPITFFIVILSIKLIVREPKPPPKPAEEVSPHLFRQHSTTLRFPYANNVGQKAHSLEESMFSASGIGSLCNLNRKHQYKQTMCGIPPEQKSITKFHEANNRSSVGCNCCNCQPGLGHVCTNSSVQQYIDSFASIQLPSGEILLNLKGESMQQYFQDTDEHAFKVRFGGLEIASTNFKKNIPLRQHSNSKIDNVIRIWFDGRAEQSGPAYLNGVNNIILRTNCSDKVSCGISTWFDQLPLKYKNTGEVGFVKNVVPIALLFTLSFASTSWVMLYIKEKSTKMKLLQQLEGLSPINYWVTGLLLEIVIYFLFCAILLIIIAILGVEEFSIKSKIGSVASLILLFGLANVPLSGLFTYCVKSGTQISLWNGLLIFSGLWFGFYVRLTKKEGKAPAPWTSLLVLLPHYNLVLGLWDLAQFVPTESSTLDSWSNLGKHYFFQVLIGALALAFMLMIEMNLLKKCFRLAFTKDITTSNPTQDEIALHVKDLRKMYKGWCKGTTAVDGITFSVKQNTCFGLLGMNGAGKTTVLKILTGEILPSDGNIIWQSESRCKLGYCPQFDTHDPVLTPEETYTFHCRMHSYSEKEIPELVECLLKMLDLYGYKDVFCRNLSGGTNRRLSAGIAFLGAPQMVLLDEPSTGLDPVARRRIWDLVKYPSYSDQAFILVSHVMEECETLCDVIGIMVKGKFICMGPSQQLKNKFGNKYLVKISKKLLDNALQLLEWVKNKFPSSTIEEETDNVLKFSVNLSDVNLSNVFGTLNELQPKRGSDSQAICYTVSQMTLDDVFLKLANKE